VDFIFRLLGVVARFNERLSHFRVNFVPINFGIMALFVAGFLFGRLEFGEGITNDDKPVPHTVAEVLARKDRLRNYVTVKGELHPEVGFQEMTTRSYDHTQHPGKAYVVLLDAKEAVAILVRRNENDFNSGKPAMTQVTGMLDEMNSEMQSKLHDKGGKIGGVQIDTKYMLTEGRQPGSPIIGAALMAIFGLLSLAFIGTFLMKYIVFRKTGTEAPTLVTTQAALTPEKNIDLRVTGRFMLDQRNAKRFLIVRTGIATTDTGQMVIFSNIDASNKLFGMTTQKRAGAWTIALEPSGLQKIELGRLYDGLETRPALRLRYRNDNSRPAAAILSFATAAERETMLHDLRRFAGYDMART